MPTPPDTLQPNQIAPEEVAPAPNSAPEILLPQEINPDIDRDTLLEKAKTAAEGAASAPSFGASRQLETKLFDNAAEQRARIEENPGLSVGSEIIGLAADPFGLVGKVGTVGKGAEKLASPVVQKILGSTVGKIGAKGLGSAAEGAFYGAGNAVSENALGNADLNAETIMHNVGYGSAINGGIGAALGLGGKLLTPAAKEAAAKEIHLENSMPTGPVTSLEDLRGLNNQAELSGFQTELPSRDAVIKAGQNLAGDMKFLPHGAQIASLNSPESRLAYQMQLKSQNELGDDLRQFEINQKHELSQQLLPKTIQEIAPDTKLADDVYQGGKQTISDFMDQYQTAKEAEAPYFDQLDKIKTQAVSDPKSLLTNLYQDFPGMQNLVKVRPATGDFYLRPWRATSGLERGTYSNLKEVVNALNKEDLSIGDVRNLRNTMKDAANNWEKPTEAFQISQLRRHLMDYMQDQAQKAVPDLEVREFFKRYAQNEQNRSIIESIFGGSLDDKAKFGKAVEPEKILPRIFSSLEDVKAAKSILGEKWPTTAANYMNYLHDAANDPVKGFSSAKFNRAINDVKSGKNLIIDEALSRNPEQLQKIRDATTIMRSLPDAPPGNPSDTASATRLIQKATRFSNALLHPTEILGFVAHGIAEKLDQKAQTAAIEKMLSKGAEDSLEAKSLKYNAFGAVERMKQQAINKIENGVSEILSGKKFSGAQGLLTQKLIPEDQQKKFDKVSAQIKEISANPDLLIDHLENVTKDVHSVAPVLATSLGTTMARATQFLMSKLPAQEKPSFGTPAYKPAPSELYKFNRYYSAVNKPLGVLKDVHAGIVTLESLEALESVHPNLFKTMQHEMLDQVLNTKDMSRVPYSTRLAISMFLGQDLTNSLKPENIISSQIPTPPPPQGPLPGNKKGVSKIAKAEMSMTPMQKSQARIE